MHGSVELILDNAPARSAELLLEKRVDAALVPVIAYHEIEDVRLVRGVCVGAKEKVRSVCLVTRGKDLRDVRSVALDVSSRTSVVLTKIIFREFLGFEPEWRKAEPDVESMLDTSDCALLIGDPALSIADCGLRNAESLSSEPQVASRNKDLNRQDSAFRVPHSAFRKFDVAQLWRQHTGLGFVFAMWMTREKKSPLDFAAARDEGLARVDEIVSNYLPDIRIGDDEFRRYLTENISYTLDDELQSGMELYFTLAKKHGLCEPVRELIYAE
jgi:chorismate dehydratase